jgi:diaminohydroxyphosphoribosylaminopyrimidine deaminase / 5-amino-6-(5-phosphoribosylamino)uracil reductase
LISKGIISELKINSLLAMGYSSPNPPVACVITDLDHNILCSAHTQKTGFNHAEREAYLKLGENFSEKHNLYVTLEPCSHFGRTPPCLDLLLKYRPQKVFLGIEDPNPLVRKINSISVLKENDIHVEISSEIQEIANEFLGGYLSRIRNGVPKIFIKSALSKEGYFKSNLNNRESISSSKSNNITQFIRQSIDAIIVGPKTVYSDSPKLNFRKIEPNFNYVTDSKDIFFNTIQLLMKDARLVNHINNRDNQPYRIFLISEKYFPLNTFFKDQYNLDKSKNIFICIDKLGLENQKMLKEITINELFFIEKNNFKDTLNFIYNKFNFNNILAEGGNFIYEFFIGELKKIDKIIEIRTETIIQDGIKPIWNNLNKFKELDRFELDKDKWIIKGI